MYADTHTLSSVLSADAQLSRMSLGDNMLERLRGTYSADVDLRRFRALLRAERKRRVGGADKLAALARIDRTTIYRIETDAEYEPGIGTVATLIEAMPGLTLSAFFTELERLRNPSLPDTFKGGKDRTPPEPAEPRYEPSRVASSSTPLPPDAELTITELGRLFGQAAITAAREQTPDPRAHRPSRRPRPRKIHRRSTK